MRTMRVDDYYAFSYITWHHFNLNKSYSFVMYEHHLEAIVDCLTEQVNSYYTYMHLIKIQLSQPVFVIEIRKV